MKTPEERINAIADELGRSLRNGADWWKELAQKYEDELAAAFRREGELVSHETPLHAPQEPLSLTDETQKPEQTQARVTMNFMEMANCLNQGKKCRRTGWEPHRQAIYIAAGNIVRERGYAVIKADDIIATDWTVETGEG